MANLVFNAKDLLRAVEHSIAAPAQGEKTVSYGKAPDWTPVTKPVTEPAVLLVKDRGIYLMSNGQPGDPADPTTDINAQYWPRYCAYALGCHPDNDKDWYDTARDMVGGDDFVEVLPWAKDIKRLIDQGYKTIVLRLGTKNILLGPGRK